MGVGERRFVPGAGICTTEITEDRYTRRIKLVCESPRSKLAGTRARLWSPVSGRDWKTGLGDARRWGIGSQHVWLSPLERDQVYWDIVPEPVRPSDRSRVPASEVASARIEIIAQEVTGYASIRFEFRDLDLKRYLYLPKRPSFSFAGAR
jgi:hypothetical protein